MRRILGLYDHPPADGWVLCVDEFGPLNLQPRAGQAWRPVAHPVRLRATYTRSDGMRPAWFWRDDQTIVDCDDEEYAVVRSCLGPRDWFFDPAWHYYPDWILLAAIDTYRQMFGAAPGPMGEGCRNAALAAGPWWPLDTVA
ncbi:hypothetical protein ACN261_32260 [Micromonospora sp. WMMD723]|uniref:hypothetical protein n=1 Tax=unclassified Micromonospora TaxID=2617518 RepID=UPI003B94D43E